MEQPPEDVPQERPAPEPWLPPPEAESGPALRRPAQIWISWACVAALAGFCTVVALLSHLPPPEMNFPDPGAYLLHTSGKSLEAAEAMENAGGLFVPYRAVNESLTGSGDPLAPVAATLAEWTEEGEGVPEELAKDPGSGLRAFLEGIDHSTDVHALRLLAVVQFERGETEAAEAVLRHLHTLEDGLMADRIGAAYGVSEPPQLAGRGLPPIETPWAEQMVAERAAERRGDTGSAARHRAERLDAGRRGAWTLLLIDGGVICMALLGVVLLQAYFIVRPDLTVAAGLTRPPWSAAEGFGVIARGGLAGLVMGQCCCGMWALAASPAMWVATLMMGVPSLLLGVLYLHRPYGVHFLHAFGMVEVRWGKMLAVTFACLCLTFTAQTVATLVFRALGAESHWAEAAAVAPLVMGNWFDAANTALAVSAGAPIGEELLFRAYLYSALRTRFGPWPSILLSAAAFGAVHPYSLMGLIAVGASGAIWAWAYERTRSLWPALLCHSLMNTSVVILQVGVYR